VRIRGAGHANLRTEELAFIFRPRAKGLGLFRLQTPLRVSGTLTDQRFGFEQRDVFESVLRVIASPVLCPIEWFTLGPQPRDGADVCTDPLRTRALTLAPPVAMNHRAGPPRTLDTSQRKCDAPRPRYFDTVSDSTTRSSTYT
jgi:hypothetical protein